MKLAINPKWRGKMPKNLSPNESQLWWREFNGNFLNVDITNNDFAKAVRFGFAYTSQHARYRKKENFAQSQFVAIDYDTEDERSSFDTLLSDELIDKYASFLHTTPSHTNERPRCRVVFELDRPITNVYKYELLVRSFLYHYGDSDASCKDGNRLYFGAVDCDVHYVNKVMPLDVARDVLVVPYSEHIEQCRLRTVERIANGTSNIPNEVVQYEVARLLERVRTARNGEKHYTLIKIGRLFGGLSAAGYFDSSSAIRWLQGAITMNENDVDDVRAAYRVIEQSVRLGTSEPYFLS
jgi:hypothetical protein